MSTQDVNPVLQAARDKRGKTQDKLDALLLVPTEESRALTDDETSQFEVLGAKLSKLDKQIVELDADTARKDKAAAAASKVNTSPAHITREAMTYDLDGRNSFFRDLAVIGVPGAGELGSREDAERRMMQHRKELDITAREDDTVRRRLHEVLKTPQSLVYRNRSEFEKRVNPSTTVGQGGEFVPPLWLVSQYVPFVRPDRVCANRVQNLPLPPGIDVINLPKITVGSATAIQGAQGGAVASVDIQTSTVSAAVNTIAGQEDISLQLLEQSPLAMDGVIFDDLTRDYSQRLDAQVLYGSGTGGQHKGVLNVSGATSNTLITNSNYVTVGSIVFHDASTSGTQFRSILNGINQVETLRIAPATAIWAHPRRANSWVYATDTQARPLYLANRYNPMNAVGTEVTNVEQGVAGELIGLPVIKDANMPTTMNSTTVGGGTADPIVILKEDDLYLWEGTMRMRALPEILSGTLQIRFQLYCYSAFMPNRFPPSLSLLTGNTGLAVPGF